jgi:hypothetical protein
MQYSFKAKIYKVGINPCVDVPKKITGQLQAHKGYIPIKGTINNHSFTKNLVPVKDAPYRLYTDMIMLKGSGMAVGKTASFVIEQDSVKKKKDVPFHSALKKVLQQKKLLAAFESLTRARRNDILKYLHQVKTEETLQRNIAKVIAQLEKRVVSVRIP